MFYFLYVASALPFPRPVNTSNEWMKVTQMFEEVLMCNYTDLSIPALVDNVLYASYKSHILNTNGQCLKVGSFSEKCVNSITKICQQKKLRVLKTVRTAMEEIWMLLSRGHIPISQLKVIHLMRDPRGQFKSLMKSAEINKEGAKAYCKKLCDRAVKDVLIREKIRKYYPSNIMSVQYESVAENPIKAANQIYQFIQGTDAPLEVQTWLKQSTHSSEVKEEQYGTVRRDSMATAQAWRKALDTDVVRDIDSVCSNYYKLSGFYTALE